MDIGDIISSNVFDEQNGDNSPVFNVLQIIDRWTIGERPISDNPMPSGSARPLLEKQSQHSIGNKRETSVSKNQPHTIVRPWESQSSNVMETQNSTVFGNCVNLQPDVQKGKKITKILEVSPADMGAGHSSPTSEFAKPESKLTCNTSTFTDSLEKQDQIIIQKTRKSFHNNYKEENKIEATIRTKMNHKIIVIYECNKCDFKVTELSNFKKHMETCTDLKPFARTQGDYRTDIIGDCTRLTRVHTNEKQHACKECNYSFVHKRDLKKHMMRIHTKEKPYACKECNYRAAHKSNLNEHMMRNHAKNKPYACKECNYSAARKCDLNLHMMRIHTKEKPYACKECNYSAANNSDLNKHMRIHTKEKPYACKECKYSAAFKCNLIKHIKRIHTKEKPHAYKEFNYSAA